MDDNPAAGGPVHVDQSPSRVRTCMSRSDFHCGLFPCGQTCRTIVLSGCLGDGGVVMGYSRGRVSVTGVVRSTAFTRWWTTGTRSGSTRRESFGTTTTVMSTTSFMSTISFR